MDIAALNQFLMEKYDMRISNGYGDLKGKTFRIATMGETTLEDVNRLLEGMEKFLAVG
jgi:aspartate aminotransferase-like enzyme